MIFVGDAGHMGRGVFAAQAIAKGTVISRCPTWWLSQRDVRCLTETGLHGHYFDDPHSDGALLPLGLIFILNHSATPNAQVHFEPSWAVCEALCDIARNEQVFIDYGPGVTFD